MFLGANPGGKDEAAQFDELTRTLSTRAFSAYVDEKWWRPSGDTHSAGNHAMQRRVQEASMLLAGISLAEVQTTRSDMRPAPNRLPASVLRLIRSTPAGNLVPFRSTSSVTLAGPLKSNRASGLELFDLASPTVLLLLGTGGWQHIRRHITSKYGAAIDEERSEDVNRALGYAYKMWGVRTSLSALRVVIGLPAFNYKALALSDADRALTALERDVPRIRAAFDA